MKKILLVFLSVITVFTLTACGSSEKRTVEYLIERYEYAYMNADVDTALDIFPPYYVEYAKDFMTKEHLEETLANSKTLYGDDFSMSYDITGKTKFTTDELNNLDSSMKATFNTDAKAEECYKVEGTMTYKGSIKEDKGSISGMGYCKYDGVWYLVRY